MTEYTVEVPNTTVKETVFGMDNAEPICYDLAQEYGLAEDVYYALNGNRVVMSSYTNED